MANTATVYARIDPALKNDVEIILDQLGVTPSALIQMLYSQIKLTNGIPFELKLPAKAPIFIDEITKEQLDLELAKGLRSAEEGRVRSANEVEELLAKEMKL